MTIRLFPYRGKNIHPEYIFYRLILISCIYVLYDDILCLHCYYWNTSHDYKNYASINISNQVINLPKNILTQIIQ